MMILGVPNDPLYSIDAFSDTTDPIQIHIGEMARQGTLWVDIWLLKINADAGYKRVELMVRNNFAKITAVAKNMGGSFDFHLYYVKDATSQKVNLYLKSSENVMYKGVHIATKKAESISFDMSPDTSSVSSMTEITIS